MPPKKNSKLADEGRTRMDHSDRVMFDAMRTQDPTFTPKQYTKVALRGEAVNYANDDDNSSRAGAKLELAALRFVRELFGELAAKSSPAVAAVLASTLEALDAGIEGARKGIASGGPATR